MNFLSVFLKAFLFENGRDMTTRYVSPATWTWFPVLTWTSKSLSEILSSEESSWQCRWRIDKPSSIAPKIQLIIKIGSCLYCLKWSFLRITLVNLVKVKGAMFSPKGRQWRRNFYWFPTLNPKYRQKKGLMRTYMHSWELWMSCKNSLAEKSLLPRQLSSWMWIDSLSVQGREVKNNSPF